MTAAVPEGSIPPMVRSIAAGAEIEPVWRNDIGGTTFRIAGEPGAYVKWQPRHPEIVVGLEAAKLRWARAYTPVPVVLTNDANAQAEWLVTTPLGGVSAVAPRWLEDPVAAVRGVGRGLRLLHDAIPVSHCPWTWTASDRIAAARARGTAVPADLDDVPPVDRLVVCHGDACCPNTILDDDGGLCGHVDLGSLGVADLWADLAVAAMSTRWNYGPGHEDALIDAYGISPDRPRIEYYQRLWSST